MDFCGASQIQETVSAIAAKKPEQLTPEDIVAILCTPWQILAPFARAVADARKGRHVFVRGLLEFANICQRNCLYCGLRRQNRVVPRYRLTREQILTAAKGAQKAGVDTLVLQSGEGACPPQWLAQVVHDIKDATGLPITLSVGEHSREVYALWREAGADRYLIKHETADDALYSRLHPGYSLQQRLAATGRLQNLGYETGGGFMVGLPGQTLQILARDILLCRDLRLDMVGAGPFIPQVNTPLAAGPCGSAELTLRVIAALRLAMPTANIPATTALATIDPADGQANGLRAGANVLMPSFTPQAQSASYTIYDHKNRVTCTNAAQTVTALGMTHPLKIDVD